MPSNLPIEEDEGPKGNQIIDTIQRQVFLSNNTTSKNGVLEDEGAVEEFQGENDAAEEETVEEELPKQDWLDKETGHKRWSALPQVVIWNKLLL